MESINVHVFSNFPFGNLVPKLFGMSPRFCLGWLSSAGFVQVQAQDTAEPRFGEFNFSFSFFNKKRSPGGWRNRKKKNLHSQVQMKKNSNPDKEWKSPHSEARTKNSTVLRGRKR